MLQNHDMESLFPLEMRSAEIDFAIENSSVFDAVCALLEHAQTPQAEYHLSVPAVDLVGGPIQAQFLIDMALAAGLTCSVAGDDGHTFAIFSDNSDERLIVRCDSYVGNLA